MSRNHMMIAVLLVIAAAHAWPALVERELPRFNLTIAGVALMLAVIVALSRYDFPVKPDSHTPEKRATRRVVLLMALSGTVASIAWIALAPWEPRADFDVTGFLFLIQNPWQVLVLAIFAAVAFTGFALSFRP